MYAWSLLIGRLGSEGLSKYISIVFDLLLCLKNDVQLIDSKYWSIVWASSWILRGIFFMQTLKHLKLNKYLTLRQNSKTSWERPVAHEHYFLPLLTKNWHQKDAPYKKEQKKDVYPCICSENELFYLWIHYLRSEIFAKSMGTK